MKVMTVHMPMDVISVTKYTVHTFNHYKTTNNNELKHSFHNIYMEYLRTDVG